DVGLGLSYVLRVRVVPNEVVRLDVVLVHNGPLSPSTSTPQIQHHAAERPRADDYSDWADMGNPGLHPRRLGIVEAKHINRKDEYGPPRTTWPFTDTALAEVLALKSKESPNRFAQLQWT